MRKTVRCSFSIFCKELGSRVMVIKELESVTPSDGWSVVGLVGEG